MSPVSIPLDSETTIVVDLGLLNDTVFFTGVDGVGGVALLSDLAFTSSTIFFFSGGVLLFIAASPSSSAEPRLTKLCKP
jgi:hypothetical protein